MQQPNAPRGASRRRFARLTALTIAVIVVAAVALLGLQAITTHRGVALVDALSRDCCLI
jgi:hypothetical protein